MGPRTSQAGGNIPWKDLNMDEKIERIHEVVRDMVQKVSFLEQQLNTTTQNVKSHSHDKDGDAIVAQKIGGSREYSQEIPPMYPSVGHPPTSLSVPQLDNGEDAYF